MAETAQTIRDAVGGFLVGVIRFGADEVMFEEIHDPTVASVEVKKKFRVTVVDISPDARQKSHV